MSKCILIALLLTTSLFSSGDWMDRAIATEFARWEKTGITQEMIDETWELCHAKRSTFRRYQVINSKIYGDETPFKLILREIAKRYPLPDLDIIYYHHEAIRERFFQNECPLEQTAPILISSKHQDLGRLVLFMYWYYNITNTEGGWNGLIKTLDGVQSRYPWDQKTDKLFWRGCPTDGPYRRYNWRLLPRAILVQTAKKHLELIDAAFVSVREWETENIEWFMKRFGLAPFVPPEDHLAYKYQLVVDGVTSTYPGILWRLHSGCLSFIQASDQKMWFTDQLIPWKHYVPVKQDLSDLCEKIQWAKEHDAEARQIAENAREFSQTHLMPEQILLYCYKILCKYAELQRP